jgi:hypothetical protein
VQEAEIVESDLNDSRYRDCLVDSVLEVEFPPIPENMYEPKDERNGVMIIRYPVVFTAKSSDESASHAIEVTSAMRCTG